MRNVTTLTDFNAIAKGNATTTLTLPSVGVYLLSITQGGGWPINGLYVVYINNGVESTSVGKLHSQSDHDKFFTVTVDNNKKTVSIKSTTAADVYVSLVNIR